MYLINYFFQIIFIYIVLLNEFACAILKNLLKNREYTLKAFNLWQFLCHFLPFLIMHFPFLSKFYLPLSYFYVWLIHILCPCVLVSLAQLFCTHSCWYCMGLFDVNSHILGAPILWWWQKAKILFLCWKRCISLWTEYSTWIQCHKL